MKIFCILFCFYLLYMVSLPCKDGEGCQNEFCTEQVNHHHHSHSGDQDHPDGCSPFCICSCCNVTVVLNNFYFIPPLDFIAIKTRFILREDQSLPYFFPIWEPPRNLV